MESNKFFFFVAHMEPKNWWIGSMFFFLFQGCHLAMPRYLEDHHQDLDTRLITMVGKVPLVGLFPWE